MVPSLSKSLLLLFIVSTVSAVNYPNPEPCSGVCEGYVHDPSVVLRSDGTYFRFTTSNGSNIATAPSLSGPWTHVGYVLPNGSKIKFPDEDIWAPDCLYSNGTYYLTYAAVQVSDDHNSDIGIATSTTMEPGSWTDHGSIGIPTNASYNKIDPNMFQMSATTPYYLSFGSFDTDIYQVTMSHPPLTSTGNMVHLEQNTTARPDGLPKGPSEGSYQFSWNVKGTIYYYLFFSSGQCCETPPNLAPPGEEYKVMVCRSTNPRSGFVDHLGRSCLTQNGGTEVLASHGDVYAPGGQGVMFDPSVGSPVMYYHYVNTTVGYDHTQFFFGWNKLNFTSGWPVVVPT